MRQDQAGWRRTIGTAAAAAALAIGAVTAGCGDDSGTSRSDVVAHYAEGVHTSYATSLESAEAMHAAIDAFVASPSAETLQAAKDAWLAARDDYGRTEAFRFYGGPIDNEQTGKEGEINAWPLDEAYVDYVVGQPNAGIVNTPAVLRTISADGIADLNEKGGETNVSTGWHAIEFLLWGQDRSADGPGARPFTDYTTHPNAERRKQYLAVASDKLLVDLEELVDAWAPEVDGNYRAEFIAAPEDDSLRKILLGIGELSRGELSGERMNVAYADRSEEDEHSCFSDNTVNDFIANAEGIRDVYTGDYPGAVGPGISDLVAQEDADLDAAIIEALDASVANTRAIPEPFDQLVQEGVPDSDPGREQVLATIVSLEDQADLLVDAGSALDIQVVLS